MTIAVVFGKDLLEKTTFTSAKKLFYAAGALILPLVVVAIYTAFLGDLSVEEVRQCLPYLGGDEPYNKVGPLETVPLLIKSIYNGVIANWISLTLFGVIVLCLFTLINSIVTKKFDAQRRNTLLFIFAYAALFYVLNMHEFLKSGVFYRTYWAQPLSVFLLFAVVASGTEQLSRITRGILWTGFLALITFVAWNNTQRINSLKDSTHYFGMPRAKVYLKNDRVWKQTVVLTIKQLNSILKGNETFFALPYDCLYYFLMDKESPTRQLIFFDHINIPYKQEEQIIKELESKGVKIILVSSRQSSPEQGLGQMGATYCPLIAQYINTNFSPVAKIGDWDNVPGWAWNHGTLLLIKK
jgi:hypothetical protein